MLRLLHTSQKPRDKRKERLPARCSSTSTVSFGFGNEVVHSGEGVRSLIGGMGRVEGRQFSSYMVKNQKKLLP